MRSVLLALLWVGCAEPAPTPPGTTSTEAPPVAQAGAAEPPEPVARRASDDTDVDGEPAQDEATPPSAPPPPVPPPPSEETPVEELADVPAGDQATKADPDIADDGATEATVETPDPPSEAVEEPVDEPAGPVDYALTTRGSFVAVLVRYDRSALVGGHDHVLVAKAFDGAVSWTSGNAAACDIRVTVPARSLAVDPPGSRERVGFEGTTPDKDKPKILDNALGKNQLDAARHPELRFRSTACSGSGESVKVSGVLTIRGVDKKVSVPMKITEDGTSFSARGRVSFSHADFGFKPFTAALGALRNDDKLTLELNFKGSAGG